MCSRDCSEEDVSLSVTAHMAAQEEESRRLCQAALVQVFSL